MAVDITLLNSNSLVNISTNFTRVQAALQETLGRLGDIPNSMGVDIDMNGNDVLNVGRIDVQEFYMNGNPIISIPGIGAVVAIAQQIIDVAAISAQVVLVSNNIGSIDLVGTNIGTVVAVASNMATIVAVNANSTNINTVASNITNINTTATNMAAIIAAPTQAANAATSASNAATSAANALASESNVALAGVGAGSIIMRFGPLLPGYLAWGEGGTFDRAVYPGLAAWLDTNGASLGLTAPQIASGTIPDWRDYSPRTAGGALGPAVGAKQEDAMQAHEHFQHLTTAAGSTYWGDDGTGLQNRANIYQSSIPTYGQTGRTATETRVKSFGVRWQIKAFGAVVNAGTADLVAIANGYNTLLNGAVRKDVDQSAGYGVPEKVTILKNALQSIEHISSVLLTSAATTIEWSGLAAFRELWLEGFLLPTTSGPDIGLQASVGGVWLTGAAEYAIQRVIVQSSAISASAINAASFLFTSDVEEAGSNAGAAFSIRVSEFNKARHAIVISNSYHLNAAGSANTSTLYSGRVANSSGRDGVRLVASAGQFAATSSITLSGRRG